MGSAILSFAVVAGMVTVVPGLDTSLVLRSALTHGRRAALTTAAGVNLGLLVWGVAAAAGVTALLTASRLAFDVVRLVGAAYLVGLGAAMLWGTFRWTSRSSEPAAVERLERRPAPSASATLVRAAASNLLNPKVGAFYVMMLPQFLPAHEPPLLAGIVLALVHVAERMTWYAILIHCADRIRSRARETFQCVVNRLTGALLIGFGVKLAVSRSS